MNENREFDNFSFVHELSYQLRVKDAMTQVISTVTPAGDVTGGAEDFTGQTDFGFTGGGRKKTGGNYQCGRYYQCAG